MIWVRRGKEGTREQYVPAWGGTKRESKGRDIFIEGVIVGLSRNLSLRRFPGIHKDPG